MCMQARELGERVDGEASHAPTLVAHLNHPHVARDQGIGECTHVIGLGADEDEAASHACILAACPMHANAARV